MRHSPGTMKPHFCLFLACASLLAAQDKPKDPFVKNKPAAAASPTTIPSAGEVVVSVKPAGAEVPKNVLCFIETFTLAQGDYAALLGGGHGHAKLYESMLAAVKAGTAKLDGCHMITCKSGMRSTLECVDELIYPMEWTTADRVGFQYPTALEKHPLGDRFEFEPTLNTESGALEFTHVFSRDRFLGMRPVKADTTLPGVPVADVFEQRSPSSCHIIPGSPTLIATLNDAQPENITLVFATSEIISFKAPQVPARKDTDSLLLTTRVISLDRMKGWELLKKHAADGAACLAELKPLLAAKEAKLEHVSTIYTRSGIRADHISGMLHTYGTEYAPPSGDIPAQPSTDPQKSGTPARSAGLAGTTLLETRSLGFHVEVEALLSEDNALVDMTLAPEYVRMTGNLKDKNWNEHYPELPLFSKQQIITGYTQVADTTTLIGTLNPPGDTGANEHKDEARMWLLFMDVNLE